MKLKYAPSFACPECEGSLSVEPQLSEGEDIIEGELNCPTCDRAFPVKGGIPIFISKLDRVKKHTATSFGFKWKKFDEINEFYKKNFLDELNPLDYKHFFKGKTILDAETEVTEKGEVSIVSFGFHENFKELVDEVFEVAKS